MPTTTTICEITDEHDDCILWTSPTILSVGVNFIEFMKSSGVCCGCGNR